LEAWRFTTVAALAREIVALLEHTDYKLLIEVTPPMREQLDNELESCRTLGRVKVEVVS
jgi:hypothetical protein